MVIEAGEAKISAVDLELIYDETKLTVEGVGVSGSQVKSMNEAVTEGLVSLSGGVFAKDLPSGTINFGFVDLVGKTNTQVSFGIKSMEIVGYPAGGSEVGVVGEYVGVVTGGGLGGCRKASFDLNGQTWGVADGNVNNLDYSLAKTRALARMEASEGGALVADFNGDCIENMADLGLVMREIVLRAESL